MKNCVIIFLLILFSSSKLFAAEYEMKGSFFCFSWLSSDMVCVYTPSGTRVKFFMKSISADCHNATLTGYGWGLTSDTQYYGYAPYNSDYHSNQLPMTALPISYDGQSQQSNDNTAHLAAYDYMTTQAVSTSTACHFNYNHLSSIIRVECPMKTTESFASLTFSTSSDKFITNATMNVTNNQLTPTEQANEISLALNGVTVEEGGTLVAYLMVAPTDLSSELVELTLTTTDGKTAKQTFTAPNIKAGKCYPVTMDVEFDAADEGDDDTSDDEVLAKRNPIMENQQQEKAMLASDVIEYPTASAKDFDVDAEGQFEEYILLGDANSDGEVDTADAVLVINYYLGRTNVIDKKAADINLDGSIDTADAVGIINKYLNK